jgi:hypothetical protein
MFIPAEVKDALATAETSMAEINEGIQTLIDLLKTQNEYLLRICEDRGLA